MHSYQRHHCKYILYIDSSNPPNAPYVYPNTNYPYGSLDTLKNYSYDSAYTNGSGSSGYVYPKGKNVNNFRFLYNRKFRSKIL